MKLLQKFDTTSFLRHSVIMPFYAIMYRSYIVVVVVVVVVEMNESAVI